MTKGRRQCIRTSNGILCTSGELGPEDKQAVKEFGAQIRAARLKSMLVDEPIIIDPRKLKKFKVSKHPNIKPIKMVNALVQSQTAERIAQQIRSHLAPRNPKAIWQKVHSADPKRHIYREHLKAATGADRVSCMATTPSGLMLSGRCSRVTKRNGLLQNMGFFQMLAP